MGGRVRFRRSQPVRILHAGDHLPVLRLGGRRCRGHRRVTDRQCARCTSVSVHGLADHHRGVRRFRRQGWNLRTHAGCLDRSQRAPCRARRWGQSTCWAVGGTWPGRVLCRHRSQWCTGSGPRHRRWMGRGRQPCRGAGGERQGAGSTDHRGDSAPPCGSGGRLGGHAADRLGRASRTGN